MNNVPWVDKYRPNKLEDIVHQDEIIKTLQNTIKTGQIPHLLFYGPPGTGKTSSMLAIARELFGPKIMRERIIELNASDERGINVVRKKICTFAKTSLSSKDPKYPCPPYKLVILDEADAMTTEAQSALRKIMEDYSLTTRFCFICNYKNQIIEPIISRCMKFRFKPIENQAMTSKLFSIAEQEQININEECINAITMIAKGDIRKAIIILQNLSYLIKYKEQVSKKDVYEITGYVDPDVLNSLFEKCIDKNIDVNHIVDGANKLKAKALPVNYILLHLQDFVINKINDDQKKSLICKQLANTEKKIVDGSDEYMQILNILLFVNLTVKNKTR